MVLIAERQDLVNSLFEGVAPARPRRNNAAYQLLSKVVEEKDTVKFEARKSVLEVSLSAIESLINKVEKISVTGLLLILGEKLDIHFKDYANAAEILKQEEDMEIISLGDLALSDNPLQDLLTSYKNVADLKKDIDPGNTEGINNDLLKEAEGKITRNKKEKADFLNEDIRLLGDDADINSLSNREMEYFVARRKKELFNMILKHETGLFDNNPNVATVSVKSLSSKAKRGFPCPIMDRAAKEVLEEYKEASWLTEGAREGYTIDSQPDGYDFRLNVMQKITALRVKKEGRHLNMAHTGIGKTNAALISSIAIDAQMILVVTPNNSIEQWREKILGFVKNAEVFNYNERFEPTEGKRTFVIANYEAFYSYEKPKRDVIDVIASWDKLDLLVLDEVHNACNMKSKGDIGKFEKLHLVSEFADRVVGLTATPVGCSIQQYRNVLALVMADNSNEGSTGSDNTRAALLLNASVHKNGSVWDEIEFVRKNHRAVRIDGNEVSGLAKLVKGAKTNGKRGRAKYHEALAPVKIRASLTLVERGTILYLEFLRFVPTLKLELEKLGLTVAIHNGKTKEIDTFLSGEKDVLIMGGVATEALDGLQLVSNRIICITTPTDARNYTQLVGRIARQNSIFEECEIINFFTMFKEIELNIEYDKHQKLENRLGYSSCILTGNPKVAENVIEMKEELTVKALEVLYQQKKELEDADLDF